MRAVALIASYNERRFIVPCLEHLERQGIDAYLVDNCSTDNTVELAEPFLDRNLAGIESFPRGEDDTYNWRAILKHKEELAQTLDYEWFIHMDPDEVRLPPAGESGRTLLEALTAADREGYNAVDFAEFTFIPTQDSPDHDHPDFQRTLRTYYTFEGPRPAHQLKAWRTHWEATLESGGHRIDFPGLKIYPRQFRMKHYLFLSVPHAVEKYVARRYDPEEVEAGWHGWRARIGEANIRLPSRSEVRVSRSDEDLDPTDPFKSHYLETGEQAALPGFHVLRPDEREESVFGRPRAPKIVHRGAGTRPEIALTFDDGPSRWTEAVVRAFEEHGCRATFFLRGAAVAERPEVVARLAGAGHELGNHLWSHPDSSTLGEDQLRAEIERTADAIERAGGPRPGLIRPPYFKGPGAVAVAARDTDATAIVLRSIGSSDWEAEAAEQIVEPVLAHAQAGDIVCLHDGVSGDKRDTDSRQPTVDAVEQLIPALLERGLRPVTVSELLA